MMHVSRKITGLLALIALAVTVGCTAQYRNHGYVPLEEDLQKLAVGVDTRATVDDLIGAPTTSGVLGEGNYYYVRSRVREYGALRPEVVSRQVLAISFNENDTIRNIERFDLQDGRVVPISRRVTDNSVVGNGFFRQIFGNFGNLDPGSLFGN
jgi:outer membrane protein assembly factor BamE (lipoprotein component of BamABCDE complex)